MAGHGALPPRRWRGDTAARDTGAAFADSRLEWRRLVAEFAGTFFLVLTAAGAGVVNAVSHGEIGRVAGVTAPGLMVLALIYTIGETSGAHLNPAVTVAFAARGHFPLGRVPGYLVAQVCGATAAAGLLRSMFGTAGRLGGTFPGHGMTTGTVLLTETVLTFGLVTVILGTASGARNVGHNAAIAIGGYIALAGLWASPVSGASMNPARSLGPDLVSGDLSDVWVYLTGPVTGALLAVAVAWALRGHPSSAGDLAAQGMDTGAERTTIPHDTLELRWMFPGPLTAAMRDWFARFTVVAEMREDTYLLRPRLPGLCVKLRDGRCLEVKAFHGSPGTINVIGGLGRLEFWRKWSFPSDAGLRAGDVAPVAGWAVVRKERITAWFPLDSGPSPVAGSRQPGGTGCLVELAEISIDGEPWASVGVEASGSPALLRDALEHAVGLVFAVKPPAGMVFSLASSQSYAEWLNRRLTESSTKIRASTPNGPDGAPPRRSA